MKIASCLARFALVALLVGVSACSDDRPNNRAKAPPPEKPLLPLTLRFSPAIISEHDAYFINTSGKNLTEARFTVKFVGEDGSPTKTRYWARWALGEEQRIGVALAEVKNVQRIEVTGEAEEGVFGETWTIRAR